jgi:16S rRNA A1518/A1519 N6-dimethyltransferase RsmA/KsgA/DIM1 with predicted DNA glycosylase/AP lyase activity
VLDLAAGTGTLTRSLVARGLDVVAVEPLPGMRERLAAEAPGATALAGTAERIPLTEPSVVAVCVAMR